MICQEAQELIHGYVDGELDLVRNLEMERHFQECAACSGAHERLRADAIRDKSRARLTSTRHPDWRAGFVPGCGRPLEARRAG